MKNETQMTNEEKLSRIHDTLITQGYDEVEVTRRLEKYRAWCCEIDPDFNSRFIYFGIESMTQQFADEFDGIEDSSFDIGQSDEGF